MDLELTDEQRLLTESVEQLLARSNGGAAWPALVEFGALSQEIGIVELALIARALGERLEALPLIDTAAAVQAGISPDAGAVSLALLEPGASWSLEGGALDGPKLATHADTADALLVWAGDRLCLVPRDAAGVTVAPEPWIDDSLGLATVTLSGPPVAETLSEAALSRLLAVAAVLSAAEATGAAAGVLELACAYAGERRQFGRAIGSFQALRHLLADCYVKQDSSWSTVLFAAAALDDGTDDALQTASIAKAYVSRATQEVAQGAMQVFGGIAFTAEHPAHRFLRRILARGQQFGDARHHERALGRALLRARAAA